MARDSGVSTKGPTEPSSDYVELPPIGLLDDVSDSVEVSLGQLELPIALDSQVEAPDPEWTPESGTQEEASTAGQEPDLVPAVPDSDEGPDRLTSSGSIELSSSQLELVPEASEAPRFEGPLAHYTGHEWESEQSGVRRLDDGSTSDRPPTAPPPPPQGLHRKSENGASASQTEWMRGAPGSQAKGTEPGRVDLDELLVGYRFSGPPVAPPVLRDRSSLEELDLQGEADPALAVVLAVGATVVALLLGAFVVWTRM